jgi:hypothetical protein
MSTGFDSLINLGLGFLVGGVFFLQQPVIGGRTLVATMTSMDGERIRLRRVQPR